MGENEEEEEELCLCCVQWGSPASFTRGVVAFPPQYNYHVAYNLAHPDTDIDAEVDGERGEK